MKAKCNKLSEKAVLLIAAFIIGILAYFVANSVTVENDGGKKSPSLSRIEMKVDQTEDNVLRLFIWEGYAPQEFVDKFEREVEQKYGKKVKLDIKYALMHDDFYNVIRNKTADIVMVSHHSIKDKRFDFIKKQLIIPIDSTDIPNYEHLPHDLKWADYNVSDGKLYGVPIANGPYGLGYNTARFEQAPTSWSIFWDPVMKGKYSIGQNEYLYNINLTALAMGYSRETINSYDKLNTPELRERLRQLAVNAHSFWISIDRAEDLMGLSCATAWGDSFAEMKRRGEIWELADPQEGTIWWIDEYALTWALADRPLMKSIALDWINMSLSDDYQIGHVLREAGAYPIITNIEEQLTEEEKKRIQVNSTPGAFMAGRILPHSYSQRDHNGMKLMWEEAMKGIPLEKQ